LWTLWLPPEAWRPEGPKVSWGAGHGGAFVLAAAVNDVLILAVLA
jgi:hypothetical protein